MHYSGQFTFICKALFTIHYVKAVLQKKKCLCLHYNFHQRF